MKYVYLSVLALSAMAADVNFSFLKGTVLPGDAQSVVMQQVRENCTQVSNVVELGTVINPEQIVALFELRGTLDGAHPTKDSLKLIFDRDAVDQYEKKSELVKTEYQGSLCNFSMEY